MNLEFWGWLMKIKRFTGIFCLIILIMIAVSSVGVFATWKYAGRISTEHDLQLQSNEYPIFISNAEFVDGGGGGLSIVGYIRCYFQSKVTLSSNNASTAKAKITVFNNSTETYAFNAVKFHSNEYDNTDIEVQLNIKHGAEIAVGQSLDFEATYKYKKGVKPSNTVLNSIVHFEFMPLNELPEEEVIAVDGALGQFENIINDINNDGTFTKLITQMNDSDANDRHDDSYIGNVSGASGNDIALLEELFQGNLTLNIDGVDTEVTIIIKRQDIDGNKNTGDAEGREMSIYLTTHDLQKSSWFGSSKATVYFATFTSNDDGTYWYQLGAMYEGTATIKGYDGNVFDDGSFDTDTWRSTDNKTVSQIINGLN